MITATLELRAEMDEILVFEWPHAEDILALNPETIEWLGLKRGATFVFRTVEIVAEIEMVPEYRYGFDGNERETVTSRSERLVSEDAPRKLWHTAKRGWYWINSGGR